MLFLRWFYTSWEACAAGQLWFTVKGAGSTHKTPNVVLKQFSQLVSLRQGSCLLAARGNSNDKWVWICTCWTLPHAPAQPRNSSELILKWPESRISTISSDLSQIIGDLEVKETCRRETSALGCSDARSNTFQGILSIIQRLPLELLSVGTEVALILLGWHWGVTAAGALTFVPLLPFRLVVHSLQKLFVLSGLQTFGSGVVHLSKSPVTVIFPSPGLLWIIFEVFRQENIELEEQQGLSWLLLCFHVLSCFLWALWHSHILPPLFLVPLIIHTP